MVKINGKTSALVSCFCSKSCIRYVPVTKMGTVFSYFKSGSQENLTTNIPNIDRTPDEKIKREKILNAFERRIQGNKYGIQNAGKVLSVTKKQNKKLHIEKFNNYNGESDVKEKLRSAQSSKISADSSNFSSSSKSEYQTLNYPNTKLTPDMDIKREKMLKATQRRIESDRCGIQNPEKIAKLLDKQNRKFHMEEMAYKNYKGEGNLKWKV